MILALLLSGVCSAQYEPLDPRQPNPREMVCGEAEESPEAAACSSTVDAHAAAKLPIHIEPPRARATPSHVTMTDLRHKPKKGVLRAIAQGTKLFDAGSHGQAAVEFEKAVAADPEYALAHDWLGVEYRILGRLNEAREEFERSIALDPDSWSGHYDFAVLLSQTGDLAGAERSVRRALALSSSNPLVHLALGLLLWQGVETRAEAMQHLQIAARTLPQAQELLSNLQER